MDLDICVVSDHPLVTKSLTSMLACEPWLNCLASSGRTLNSESVFQHERASLLIIDTLCIRVELSKLVRVIRARCPGSRFLALVAGQGWADEGIIRLLYLGVDGVVEISERLEAELPAAARAILAGNVWAPPPVLARYVRQTSLILNEHLWDHHLLTARENQVLQLMFRRFSNKEIAGALGIKPRTVKFHVSNVLEKLQIAHRQSILAALDKLAQQSA